MKDYTNNVWLDEMRRRIQEALSQAKRDKLRTGYGMELKSTDPGFPSTNRYGDPPKKFFYPKTR